MRDIQAIIDRYQAQADARTAKIRDFFNPKGSTRFLVVQHPPSDVWGACNSVRQVVESNLAYLERAVALDWTDDLPFLEPWVGTGVYANAFGCDYVFRENDPPHVHYKYHTVEEMRGVQPADWRASPVMAMVLDCIDALKEATGGRVPISLTDTQSAFDTATLIMDASEYFTACYTDEEDVRRFTGLINDCVIEFSKAQIARIGESLVARPGHIVTSLPGLPGISISDDNLAVSSPHINALVSLPCDARLAEEFGGLSIHSCGTWTHTMRAAAQIPGVVMLEMALVKECDPNPNDPAAVRDALAGTGVIAKVRVGGDMAVAKKAVGVVAEAGLRLVVEIAHVPERAEANYREMSDFCQGLE